MAKKLPPSPQTAIDQWESIIERASLTDLRNVNGVIIGHTAADNLLLMIPDPDLLILLLADSEIGIIQYDREEEVTSEYLRWFDYGMMISEGWLPLDSVDLYAGKTITIQLSDEASRAFISKDSLPFKLRKAEFVDVAYRVFAEDKVIGISKRFEALPLHGFTMLKLFKII